MKSQINGKLNWPAYVQIITDNSSVALGLLTTQWPKSSTKSQTIHNCELFLTFRGPNQWFLKLTGHYEFHYLNI